MGGEDKIHRRKNLGTEVKDELGVGFDWPIYYQDPGSATL